MPTDQAVLTAGGRCDQENLVAQLKGGVHALTTPVDNLVSNWAYMVMASLGLEPEGVGRVAGARDIPARPGAPVPEANAVANGVQDVPCGNDQIPCQIVRSGRRLVYRLLSWNPWQVPFCSW